jgi:thiazole synthase ThiGH ThiG subunit
MLLHSSPGQHGTASEHCCPEPLHEVIEGWQVPVVIPAGISHASPRQQSLFAEHAPL